VEKPGKENGTKPFSKTPVLLATKGTKNSKKSEKISMSFLCLLWRFSLGEGNEKGG
jgi:hypothetical protein